MFKLKYRYCKARMAAYLDGELSLDARRRVSRYIDECPDCYREYVRHRELRRELSYRMPLFGMPRTGQLERIWAGIQENVQNTSGYARPRYDIRYSLVALALALAFLLPMALLGEDMAAAITVTQPTPYIEQHTGETGIPYKAMHVAIATRPADLTDEITTITPEAVPQRTPDPGE